VRSAAQLVHLVVVGRHGPNPVFVERELLPSDGVNTPAAAQERQGRRHAEFTHHG